jgi:Tfp pilus assembly protein PilV
MRMQKIRPGRLRRGMTLLEAGVAILVMSAAMVAVVELVGALNKERRIRHQRQVAVLELANQAERVTLLNWEDIAPDRFTKWEPSPMLLDAIPNAVCQAQVQEDSDQQPTARRIELSIGWKNAAGEAVKPATLTVWKYPDGDGP